MQKYVIALYIRLSIEDYKYDSLSIENQSLVLQELEKDCTVKSITRVNLRFKVDNSLRLANDSTATTRGGDNNMVFELLSDKKNAAGGDGGSPDNPNGSGGGEDGDNNGEAPDPAE